jgi:hypothetical protein
MAYVHLLRSFSLKIEKGQITFTQTSLRCFYSEERTVERRYKETKMDFLRRKVYGIRFGCKSMNG